MFNVLIVPTRLSTTPDPAVAFAARLARHSGLLVEAITVLRSSDYEPNPDRRQRAMSAGADRLTVLHGDDIATEIIEHARNRNGALLVMTTGATALLSLQRHSVTSRVLAALPQPVLFLGPAVADDVTMEPATLVVGVDRTLHSQPVLPVVESWRRSFGGRPPQLVDIIPTTAWPSDPRDEAIELERLDAVVDAFEARGIDTVPIVLHDNEPVDALLGVAAEVPDPVFVMTSRRWTSGPSHWYSTTRKLLRHSTRPVLVVSDRNSR